MPKDINWRQHLKPCKPGETRNPNGRPKREVTLVSCIKSALDQIDKPTGKTKQQLIAELLVNKAVKGDMLAAKLAIEYTVGRPAQVVTVDSVAPVAVSFTVGSGYSPVPEVSVPPPVIELPASMLSEGQDDAGNR